MTSSSNSERVLSGEAVRISLTRADVLRMQLEQTPRRASAWIVWGVFVIGTGFGAVAARCPPPHFLAYVVLAISAIAGGTALFVLGVGAVLGTVLLMSRPGDGLLGEHVYTFEAEGIREQFSAGHTFLRWDSVRTLRRSRNFILIVASPRAFHLLPRRYFESSRFDDLWAVMRRQREDGAPRA
jgi:YcxB-like protein